MLPDNLTWFHVQIQHYLQLHLPPFHSLNLHSSFKNYMFLHEFIASLLTSLSVLVTINVTELPQHPFSQPHSLPFTPSTHTFTLQKAITQHLDQRPSPPWNLFHPLGGRGTALFLFCFVFDLQRTLHIGCGTDLNPASVIDSHQISRLTRLCFAF